MHITYKQPQLVEVSAALHNGTSDYHSVVLGRRTPGHDRETVSELGDRPVLNITKKPDNTSELVTKNIGLLNCGVKTRQRLIVQDLLPSVLCYLLYRVHWEYYPLHHVFCSYPHYLSRGSTSNLGTFSHYALIIM